MKTFVEVVLASVAACFVYFIFCDTKLQARTRPKFRKGDMIRVLSNTLHYDAGETAIVMENSRMPWVEFCQFDKRRVCVVSSLKVPHARMGHLYFVHEADAEFVVYGRRGTS